MIQNRRTFLELAAAAVLPLGAEQAAPRRGAVEIARHALSGPLADFEIVLVELNSPPSTGATGTPHRHPGPVLGYVLEGQMRFGVDNQPPQALKAGQTFFEPTGALHSGSGSASADAGSRGLAFMVVPKGSPTVSPG